MTDIEHRLRDALGQRARSTTLTRPGLPEARTTSASPRRTILLVMSIGAVVLTVVGLVVLANRSAESPPSLATHGWRTLAPPRFAARDDQAMVWTGHQLLVWGGGTYNSSPANDGAAYDPASDSWTTLPASPLTARHDPVSVWTGTEMIIWGGTNNDGVPLDDGAAYNPTARTWRAVATAPIDTATATLASTVWTGSELIIWGGDGRDGQPQADGAAYNPATDAWRTVAASPLQARHEAATVWTGTEMVLWGGAPAAQQPGYTPFADGAAYNPTTDTWRPITAAPLDGRIAPAAWTGTEMLVVAGRNKDSDGMFAFGDGAAYNPTTDTWRKIADGPAHPGFQATWTGTKLLTFAKGLIFSYDPATDSWSPRNDADQFPGGGRLLWTGHQLFLVGTTFQNDAPTGIVAAYTP